MLRPNLSALKPHVCLPVGVRIRQQQQTCMICSGALAGNLGDEDPRLGADTEGKPLQEYIEDLSEELAQHVYQYDSCGHWIHERCAATTWWQQQSRFEQSSATRARQLESGQRDPASADPVTPAPYCGLCRVPLAATDRQQLAAVMNTNGNRPDQAEINRAAEIVAIARGAQARRQRAADARAGEERLASEAAARQRLLLAEQQVFRFETIELEREIERMRDDYEQLRELYERPERQTMSEELRAESDRLELNAMARELQRIADLEAQLEQQRVRTRELELRDVRMPPGVAWTDLTGLQALPARVVDQATRAEYLTNRLFEMVQEPPREFDSLGDQNVEQAVRERVLNELVEPVNAKAKNDEGLTFLQAAIRARNMMWVHVMLWHSTFLVDVLAKSGTKRTDKRRRKSAIDMFLLEFPGVTEPNNESVPREARLVYPFLKSRVDYALSQLPGASTPVPGVDPAYQMAPLPDRPSAGPSSSSSAPSPPPTEPEQPLATLQRAAEQLGRQDNPALARAFRDGSGFDIGYEPDESFQDGMARLVYYLTEMSTTYAMNHASLIEYTFMMNRTGAQLTADGWPPAVAENVATAIMERKIRRVMQEGGDDIDSREVVNSLAGLGESMVTNVEEAADGTPLVPASLSDRLTGFKTWLSIYTFARRRGVTWAQGKAMRDMVSQNVARAEAGQSGPPVLSVDVSGSRRLGPRPGAIYQLIKGRVDDFVSNRRWARDEHVDEKFVWKYIEARTDGPSVEREDAMRMPWEQATGEGPDVMKEDLVVNLCQKMFYMQAIAWQVNFRSEDYPEARDLVQSDRELYEIGEQLLRFMGRYDPDGEVWNRDAMQRVSDTFRRFHTWMRQRLGSGRQHPTERQFNQILTFFFWEVLLEVAMVARRADGRIWTRHRFAILRLYRSFVAPLMPAALRAMLGIFAEPELIPPEMRLMGRMEVPNYIERPALPAYPKLHYPGSMEEPLQAVWYGLLDEAENELKNPIAVVTLLSGVRA